MKTTLLPLVAIISMAAFAPAQAAPIQSTGNGAYAVDSSGNLVRDSYGACVRSSSWTKEKAIAACETPVAAAKTVATESKSSAKSNKPAMAVAPVAAKVDYSDIQGNDQFAYAVDSTGRIVRDGYGGCVRTINWTKETAIAKCEGWEEAKPVVAAAPVVEAPVATPAPVVKKQISVDVPASFTGFFDFDKTDLKSAAKEELDAYSDYMTTDQSKNIKITGHTDTTGPAAYNQDLSERRAEAAKTYLEEKGIDGQRIETLGKGETSPAVSNATREGRAENRRIEIEVAK